MEVKNFINGKVTYDKFGGQYFWINQPNGGAQMLAELRGWGAIQNMFSKNLYKKDGAVDFVAAGEFQDKIGEFIAEAINEKIERAAMVALPSIVEAGAVAVEVASCVKPKLTEQQEAFFIAGFLEMLKYLGGQIKNGAEEPLPVESEVTKEVADSPSTEKRLTAIAKEDLISEGWYNFKKGSEFKAITLMKKLTLVEDGLGFRYWIKNDLLEIVSK